MKALVIPRVPPILEGLVSGRKNESRLERQLVRVGWGYPIAPKDAGLDGDIANHISQKFYRISVEVQSREVMARDTQLGFCKNSLL